MCVKKCKLCPRMNDSARILGLSSGTLDAKIMFIGEAPGRLGADSTGIPFHGDRAGDNFENLLEFSGISREDLFITNAVLCNPKDEKGNNSPPNKVEINNCSNYLQEQIDLINPTIVVTLGANALKATGLIEVHDLTLKDSVRTAVDWYGRSLIPLYHPGQRAMLHRSLPNQRSDYQFLAEQIRRIGVKKRKVHGKTNETLVDVVKAILSVNGDTSYFALHKLVYLLELGFSEEFGDRLTGAYFIRQKDGPYCTDLHITKLKNAIDNLKIIKNGVSLVLGLPPKDLFDEGESLFSARTKVDQFINKKILEFRNKTNAEIKTRVYLTKPMKNILKQEKIKKINMYNAPIIFE
ncbi:MAG: uracil-DNA glycosylase [Gammaproteobacteria bacterium]|nr:uracil-DNA glycosylase [Gammaproteobacteria bacterium]